jgi:hypothetical protein
MYTVSLKQFLAFVEQRKTGESKVRIATQHSREKVLRSDQRLKPDSRLHERRLTTCPQCDAVIDEAIVHPRSGLCPICHDEAFHQR